MKFSDAVIFISISAFIFVSTGCSEEQKNKGNAPRKDSVISADEYNKQGGKNAVDTAGANLIGKFDCRTCHQDNVKLVGPAYLDVAKKYDDTEENYNYLAEKIVKGGSGVWGEVPMSPHPGMKKEDALKMAKYILSLNN